jgi:outer membrane protein OmpA-like peptidoglycan-associated protein
MSLIEDAQVFSGIRANAICALSTFNNLQNNENEQVVATLTKALGDDASASVRAQAAKVLGEKGVAQTLNALRKASEEDDSLEVRMAAKAAGERLEANNIIRNELKKAESPHQQFETENTQTVTLGQKTTLKGVVARRDADTLIIKDDNGLQTRVVLNDQTIVKITSGSLRFGMSYGMTVILRGLNLEVEGIGDSSGNLVAKRIRFSESDLRAARAVDAKFLSIENRFDAAEARVEHNEQTAQRISGQIVELAAASSMARATLETAQGTSAVAKSGLKVTNERISALDDYQLQNSTSVFFKDGSAVLSPQSKQQLDEVAQQARTAKGYVLEVSGFAGNDESIKDNQPLSQRRASMVIHYLVDNHQIPLHRIVTPYTPYGYGELQLITENNARSGRNPSRPVDVNMLVNRGITQSASTVEVLGMRSSSNKTFYGPGYGLSNDFLNDRNSYNRWTAIEYPALKEVAIDLSPSMKFATAYGQAKVMRRGESTTVEIGLAGLPADSSELNLYAVDMVGKATLLGPVVISNGMTSQMFNTRLDKFKLLLSAETNLTTIAPDTAVAFRSTTPKECLTAMQSSGREADGHVYLGTVPSFIKVTDGLTLEGIRKGSPAEKAGLLAGDKIVKLATRDIRNIYDYTLALVELQAGEEYGVQVVRRGQHLVFKITPTIR